MLEVAKFSKSVKDCNTLLDLGCGAGHLLQYVNDNYKTSFFEYSGIDISQKFIDLCKIKYPHVPFRVLDVLEEHATWDKYDFIVMNGVFTEKRTLTFEQMWDYFTRMISIVYNHTNTGFAFNVMSKQVDWEREDLFHVPLDLLADFLTKNISRNFVVRNDYGLYEYTVYVYNK